MDTQLKPCSLQYKASQIWGVVLVRVSDGEAHHQQ